MTSAEVQSGLIKPHTLLAVKPLVSIQQDRPIPELDYQFGFRRPPHISTKSVPRIHNYALKIPWASAEAIYRRACKYSHKPLFSFLTTLFFSLSSTTGGSKGGHPTDSIEVRVHILTQRLFPSRNPFTEDRRRRRAAGGPK